MKHCICKPWVQAVLEARFLAWPAIGQSLGVTSVILCKGSLVLLVEKSTGLYTEDKAAPCSHANPPTTTRQPATLTNANNREVTIQRNTRTY